MKFKLIFLIVSLFVVNACTAPGTKNTAEAPKSPVESGKSAKHNAKPDSKSGSVDQKQAQSASSTTENRLPEVKKELSGEILFYLLSAEIAGQRGELGAASAYYLRAAEVSRDAKVVERAARVSVYARDNKRALTAAKLWVELEPQSSEAHQVLAALLVRQGDVDAALVQMEWVVAHHEDDTSNPYMLITSLLNKEKDKQTALVVMEKLVSRRPNNVEALYAYAHLAMLTGQNKKALKTINRVLETKPTWAEAVLLKAGVLIRLGEHQRVLELLSSAVENDPENLEIRLFYARKLVDEKMYDDARNQFSEILDQKPELPDALFAVGLLNLQLKTPGDAVEYFEKLIDINKRVDDAHYYLGQTRELEKDFEAAIKHYQEVRTGSNYIEAQIRIASIYAEQGQVEAARSQLQSISANTLDIELRLILAEGEILRKAGRDQNAIDVYTVALQQMPDNDSLLYARAMTYEKLNNIEEAIKDFELIVKNDPKNPDALNALGYTLVDMTTRIEEGKNLIERALSLKPDEPAIMDSLGWAYYRLGQHEKARNYLQRAFKKMNDPEIAAHLGEVLWVMGEQDEARKVWESALSNTPKDEVLLNVIERFIP